MMTAIIIEDEQHCVNRLQAMLQEDYAAVIQVTDICMDASTALHVLQTTSPDLVFMDIQVQDTTAFNILQQLPRISFDVIFTTAHEQYAVEAFRFSAIDYLLKPVEQEALAAAITRVQEKKSKEEMVRRFEVLFHNLNQLQGAYKKIAVPVATGIEYIQVSDIIRCQSSINYTILYVKDRPRLTVAKTLKEFEELLSNYNFFRVHHSHLINLAFVKGYNKGKGGTVIMTDLSQVEVSTRRKEEFLKKLAGE